MMNYNHLLDLPLDSYVSEYEFNDVDERYTNGAMLIPSFRVREWAEAHKHQNEVHAHWEMVVEDSNARPVSGVCSNCHRQDHIDPIATHCRYCGAKMDEEDYSWQKN